MAVQTTSADNDSAVVRDTIRQEHNKLVAITRYLDLNGVASSTIATTPGCATATVTSKVKTANATVVRNAGALNAVAATDNYWTLTGGVLAVSKFRRYLLLVDSADAATVLASDDQSTAAACRFPSLPADGLAIVGILTVATDASTPFTPATTLLGAAGITATYIDGHDEAIWNVNQVLKT